MRIVYNKLRIIVCYFIVVWYYIIWDVGPAREMQLDAGVRGGAYADPPPQRAFSMKIPLP